MALRETSSHHCFLPSLDRGSKRVEAWRKLGASAYFCRAVQFGIPETPQYPFIAGTWGEQQKISQDEKDREFGLEDLSAGCKCGIYKEVTRRHATKARQYGSIISSDFTVGAGEDEERKGRIIINLSKQSRRWPHGGVQMKNMEELAMNVQRGYKFLSVDI